MNFDEAIQAHLRWRNKLTRYLATPDGSQVPAVLGRDDECIVGRWINGEGAKHAGLTEYVRLKQVHADFHRCAADIVGRANAAEPITREIAFGATSPYAKASNETIVALIALRTRVSLQGVGPQAGQLSPVDAPPT